MNPVQRWLACDAARHQDPALDRLIDELVVDVTGQVVEVGCGSGTLFHRYSGSIESLVGVDPDADCRAVAQVVARSLPFPASVVAPVSGGRMPLGDDAADVIVCCEVLCSVRSQAAMLAEIQRVLRPGGELRVLEHVAARGRVGRAGQRVVDMCGWPKLIGGCHTCRDTERAIVDAGFRWTRLRHVWYARRLVLSPVGPHIIGRARVATTD